MVDNGDEPQVAAAAAYAPTTTFENLVTVVLVPLVALGAAGGQYILSTERNQVGWAFYALAALGVVALNVLLSDGRPAPAPAARPPYRFSANTRAWLWVIAGHALVASIVLARLQSDAWPVLIAWLVGGLALVGAVWREEPADRVPFGRRVRSSVVSWHSVLLLVLTAASSGLLMVNLDEIPRGMHGDEGEFGLIALDILAGRGPHPYGVAFWGEGAIYSYIIAAFVAFLGPTATADRLSSALSGVGLILTIYVFVRDMFSTRLAIIAAGLTLTSSVIIHFSRLAIPVIHGVFLIVLSLWMLWRGYKSGKTQWYVMSGYFGAVALYFSFGSRLVVPILGSTLLLWLAVDHRQWRQLVLNSVLMAIGGLVTLAPLIAMIWQHPQSYLGHTAVRLVWSNADNLQATANRYQTTPSNIPAIALGQLVSWLASITYANDVAGFYPFPGSFVVTTTAPLLILGLALITSRIRDHRYGILAMWIFTTSLMGSLIMTGTGSFHRMLPTLPALLIGAAVLLDWMIDLARRIPLQAFRYSAVSWIVVLTVLCGGLDLNRHLQGNSNITPWPQPSMSAAAMQRLPAGTQTYLAAMPALFARHGNLRYLASHVRRDDLANPPYDLPRIVLPSVILVTSSNAHWIPLIKLYYPTATFMTRASPTTSEWISTIHLPADTPRAVSPPGGLSGHLSSLDGIPLGQAVVTPALAFRTLATLAESPRFRGEWRGRLIVPTAGMYRFEVQTDGNIQVQVDSVVAVYSPGGRGPQRIRGEPVQLSAGEHTIVVRGEWRDTPGMLDLTWARPGEEFTLILPPNLQPPVN